KHTTSKSSTHTSPGGGKIGSEKSLSLETKDVGTTVMSGNGDGTSVFKEDSGTSVFKEDSGTSVFKEDSGTSVFKKDTGTSKPVFLKDDLAIEEPAGEFTEVESEQAQVSETDAAQKEKEEERETYRKEAQMCLEVGDL